MPRYFIHCYLNTSDRFSAFEPGDTLATTDELWVELFADSRDQAAARAFIIGNGCGADRNNFTWPAGVRSISVGDVLAVTDDDGCWSAAVDPTGFRWFPGHPRPEQIVPLTATSKPGSR